MMLRKGRTLVLWTVVGLGLVTGCKFSKPADSTVKDTGPVDGSDPSGFFALVQQKQDALPVQTVDEFVNEATVTSTESAVSLKLDDGDEGTDPAAPVMTPASTGSAPAATADADEEGKFSNEDLINLANSGFLDGSSAGLRLDGAALATTTFEQDATAATILLVYADLRAQLADAQQQLASAGDGAGTGSGSPTQPAGTDPAQGTGSASTSGGTDGVAVPGDGAGLRLLSVPPSTVAGQGGTLSAADLQNIRQQIAQLQAALDRLKAAVDHINSTSPLASALQQNPSQIPCVFDGGVAGAGGVCQCRGWGLPVDGYTWTPAASQTTGAASADSKLRAVDTVRSALRAGTLTVGRTRKCPNLEALYCHGWPTRGGQCGIYSKGADWQTRALAIAAPSSTVATGANLSTASAACYVSYDKIISGNRPAIFQQNSCPNHFALLNGSKIEIWQYDPNSGGVVGQSNINTNLPGTAPGALASLQSSQIQQLCQGVRVGNVAAVYTANPESCRCGGHTMDRAEMNAFSQQEFTRQCQSSLTGGTVTPTGTTQPPTVGAVNQTPTLAQFQLMCNQAGKRFLLAQNFAGGAACQCRSSTLSFQAWAQLPAAQRATYTQTCR